MNGDPPMHGRRLIVCDVDGVIFRGQFLLSLARCRGPLAWARSLLDCLLYEWGRFRLEELLRRVYGRAAGLPARRLHEAYARLPLTPNVRHTIQALRASGHEVWLASAGVPQALVDDLVRRAGADGGIGLHPDCEADRLSGSVTGELATTDGKYAFVERLLAERGLRWRDAVAIGDDRNNLKLLERAGVSIGFRAAYAVRRRVRFLVDGDDFAAVIPFVERSPGPPHPPHRRRAGTPEPERTWRQELRRKAIHACAALAVPLHRAKPLWVLGALTGAAMLYLVGEFFRLNGMSFPVLSRVERWTLRRGERRRLALAPIMLTAGVVLPLLCFPPTAAYIAVLIVAFGDSVAAVVGRHWGRHPLPHNPYKTIEGSLVAFVAAVLCASVYLPFSSAMLIGAVASAIESLDLGDWDNILIPMGAGLAATFLLPG